MSSERYQRILSIFEAACDRSGADRAALLDEACKGDDDLRREVEKMLAGDENRGVLDAALPGGDSAPPAGFEIGAYRIEAKLGEGGMGVVFRARDRKLNRLVAVKLLAGDVADANARRRFQREAQTASSLNHPHIVTVYDAGEKEGRQYLVTEYVDGGTLADWARQRSPTWRDVVELLVGVADALAAAHEANILHRDIKPANILVTKSGYAKLADFGLAKLVVQPSAPVGPDDVTRTEFEGPTRPGVLLGTIAYMSPEQASGGVIDARSDIFSFGVVLYEQLAGRRPFSGKSDLETLQLILHGAPDPLPEGVPPALRSIVEKAIARRREDRFPAMRDMVAALKNLGRASSEFEPGRAERQRIAVPRWVWGALATAAIGIAGWAILPRRQAARPITPAQYTQLTNFDVAVHPALSPDGRMLAFVHGPETSVAWMGNPSEIYVKPLPNGDPVQLTHDGIPNKFAPRFSPDGLRIAYSALGQGWTTWVVPVLGGQPPRKLLENAEGFAWIHEPAGAASRVLFSFMTGKGITMAVASSAENGSDRRTVFLDDEIMDHFSYASPDAKNLLLVEMGFNGWQPCRVAPFDGSSKGRKVGPQPAECDGAAWSPDGKWMYFSANTGNGFHIWRQGFPDGAPEQVTFGPTEEDGVEFDLDGRSFLTSIGTVQNTNWIRDRHGDRRVSLDAYSFNSSFSSDGKKLYYLAAASADASSPGYGALWMMDLDSGRRERLLQDFQMEHYTVSADGRRVVFVSANRTGRPGVWLAAMDGGFAPRQLSSNRGLQAFFGSSGEIVFAAQEKDGTFVYRIQEDGGGLQRAIPYPVYYLYGVSPDGKYAAVWGGGPGERRDVVSLVPLGGGNPAIICVGCAYRSSNPQEVSWSADGRLVYLSLMGGQAGFSIALRSGQVLPVLPTGGLRSVMDVAALPGAKPLPAPFAVPGPDPSTYVYSKLNSQRNIYRVPTP